MFDNIKLKRENRKLKRENDNLKQRLLCIGKTLILENEVAIIPKELFLDLWNKKSKVKIVTKNIGSDNK